MRSRIMERNRQVAFVRSRKSWLHTFTCFHMLLLKVMVLQSSVRHTAGGPQMQSKFILAER